MKEYIDHDIQINRLQSSFLPRSDYLVAHANLVVACHDIMIQYGEGILLVKRENDPARGQYWPLGGRILKGVSIEESIRKKVKEECGLELTHIEILGFGRTMFADDPFGHGKGTDTFNIMYFGIGKGTLKLDILHSNPHIITPENFASHEKSLHPYVRDYVEKALKLIKK
ncbi:NUDIX hydrolase [Candidatus Woesearchaeota archaeon]|nr:NUDIX hydrolase [Candidatus Woesearchaeota archaeon]